MRACLWARLDRTARGLTLAYERALRPVGLTIAEFGVLAFLYESKRQGRAQVPPGALADFVGAKPSTFLRQLRRLKAEGLVAEAAGTTRSRQRALSITAEGGTRLRAALPLWAEAQTHLQERLGSAEAQALNGLFDLTTKTLATR